MGGHGNGAAGRFVGEHPPDKIFVRGQLRVLPGHYAPVSYTHLQYRVYPDAAATLALCAYKGYQNYMLAEGFPRLTELLPKLHLERFFPGRVVSGRVELAGSHGEGLYRRAELAAHFPGMIWLVSGDSQELARCV